MRDPYAIALREMIEAKPGNARGRFRLKDAEVEYVMTQKKPSDEASRKKDGLIEQRQQQVEPAGKNRVDANEAARRSQKQPGQDLRDPQKDADDGE